MSILDRYLTTQTATRLLLVTLIFAGVFAAYSLAIHLSRAAAGILKAPFVISIVGLRTVIAGEVILPIALYVGVVMALHRLARNEEATALAACGYGMRQLQRGLTPLFLGIALIVGLLSLWIRPTTYSELYSLRSRAEAAFDFSGIEPGRFYSDSDGERVVFTGAGDTKTMRDVFIWNRKDSTAHILRADELVRETTGDARASLALKGLRSYKQDEGRWVFDGAAGAVSTSIDFGGLAPLGYKRKAANTADLLGSTSSADLAELQWRLSRPLSVLVLGFLALRLSGYPRRPRRQVLAILVMILGCLLYQLASLTARSWVEDGRVGVFPGVFWVEGVFAFFMLISPDPGRNTFFRAIGVR